MLIWSTYGKPPNVTVTDIPGPMAFRQLAVWHDDFSPEAVQSAGGWNDGAGLNEANTATSLVAVSAQDFGVSQIHLMDAPLVTRTDADADASIIINETEIDQFGCLEIGGDFEGVHVASLFQTNDLFLPRYVQAGSTLDCDTSAPLTASQVFAHNPASGLIIASGTSDGAGAFSVPVYETGPHLIRAVNGAKTAISLPVLATTAV